MQYTVDKFLELAALGQVMEEVEEEQPGLQSDIREPEPDEVYHKPFDANSRVQFFVQQLAQVQYVLERAIIAPVPGCDMSNSLDTCANLERKIQRQLPGMMAQHCKNATQMTLHDCVGN